jgi:hypothetical protein
MKYEEIKPLLDEITNLGAHFEITLKHDGIGRLWVSELQQTDDNYHSILSALTRFYGRLDKEISYGMQSWSAHKDGQSLIVYNVAQCKVVGYRTVECKKRVEVETEEIETGAEPIYDCTEMES